MPFDMPLGDDPPLTIEDVAAMIGRGREHPARRAAIEEIVQRLVDVLDAMDAATDDLEPSLGATETHPVPTYGASPGTVDPRCSQEFWFRGARDDREEDTGDDEPDADGEPSLGSNPGIDQSAWGNSSSDDTEDEHDGAEPVNEDGGEDGHDADREPSLGWTADGEAGNCEDLEHGESAPITERPRPLLLDSPGALARRELGKLEESERLPPVKGLTIVGGWVPGW
jgi:hypothetical protein